MAEKIIAQQCEQCKGFGAYQESLRLADLIAVSVMSDSNEKARDILRVCGFEYGLKSAASFLDVCKFYGLEPRYVRNVLYRLKINRNTFPDDVHVAHHKLSSLSYRLILSLSAIMFFGNKIPKDSMAKNVFDKLKHTTYYDRAVEMKKTNSELLKRMQKEEEEAKAVQNMTSVITNELPIDEQMAEKIAEFIIRKMQKKGVYVNVQSESPDEKQYVN